MAAHERSATPARQPARQDRSTPSRNGRPSGPFYDRAGEAASSPAVAPPAAAAGTPAAIHHDVVPARGEDARDPRRSRAGAGSAASRRRPSIAADSPAPEAVTAAGRVPGRAVRSRKDHLIAPAATPRLAQDPAPDRRGPAEAAVAAERAKPTRAAAIAAYLDRHMPAAAAAATVPPPPIASPALRKLDRPIAARSHREEAGRPAPVKIHIGRIRVDGPTPPPKRPRFKRPRPLVSLADYEDRGRKR